MIFQTLENPCRDSRKSECPFYEGLRIDGGFLPFLTFPAKNQPERYQKLSKALENFSALRPAP